LCFSFCRVLISVFTLSLISMCVACSPSFTCYVLPQFLPLVPLLYPSLLILFSLFAFLTSPFSYLPDPFYRSFASFLFAWSPIVLAYPPISHMPDSRASDSNSPIVITRIRKVFSSNSLLSLPYRRIKAKKQNDALQPIRYITRSKKTK